MDQKLVVVVVGATGHQGGAVVKSLLERGHEVRAVTRNADSANAKELANAGATLVRVVARRRRCAREDIRRGDLAVRDDDAIRRRPLLPKRDKASPLQTRPKLQAYISSSRLSALGRFGTRAFRTSTASTRIRTTHRQHRRARDRSRARVLSWRISTSGRAQSRKEHLCRAAPGDEKARSARPRGHRRGRRSRARGPGPLFRQALRPRRRRELTGNDVVAILSRTPAARSRMPKFQLDVIRQRMGEDADEDVRVVRSCRLHGRSRRAPPHVPRCRVPRLRVVGEDRGLEPAP